MRPIRLVPAFLSLAPLAAQSIWLNPAPSPRPSNRCCMGMAGDLSRSMVWLFGGSLNFGLSRETWSWNGVAWTRLTPANSPSARYGHGMVMDHVRSRVVLFGGSIITATLADTWEFDGANWTLMAPGTSPSSRYEHAMAFDMQRARTVLFGGSSGGAETWEYDGVTWTQAMPALTPASRRGHGMAYHMPTGQVVLFGGSNGSTIFGDTWEWDGNNWSQATPSHVPPGRLYFSMCDDVGSGRVWMFGGRPSYTNDTWEWDGTDWTQRQPVAAPSGRAASGMAYDSVNGGPVLFGGITLGCLGDTWTFQGPTASFDGFGSGCPGSVGVPDLRADAPWLGSSWSLELDNVPTTTFAVFTGGLSNTVWNGQPLPLSLAPSGLPGCNLYVRPDTSALLPVTNGSTTLTLSIPNSPSLEGVAVYFQALVFDPGVNAAGAVGSNAGTATIAGR